MVGSSTAQKFPRQQLSKKIDHQLEICHFTAEEPHYADLKKVWDLENGMLISNNRFTAEGHLTFWKSADSAIQFWDRHLSPKGKAAPKTHVTEGSYSSPHQDNFHWPARMNNFNHRRGQPHTSRFRGHTFHKFHKY